MSQHLLTPHSMAALAGLEVRARLLADSVLAGQHRGSRKGFSTDFAEHRQYSPGDDLRHVDWKLFGKRDRLYVRQFEHETRLRCWLILDASRSMHYRSESAPLSKQHYAAILAAALAWLVLHQRDEVGCSIVDDQVSSVAANGQPQHLKQLIARLEHSLAAIPERSALTVESTTLAAGFSQERWRELVESIPVRSQVVWFTDGFLSTEEQDWSLRCLRHRRHEVRVVQVVDPAEEDFPFDQPTLFRGLEDADQQWITPQSIQAAYHEEWNRFLRETQALARRFECDYAKVRTDENLGQFFRRWLDS